MMLAGSWWAGEGQEKMLFRRLGALVVVAGSFGFGGCMVQAEAPENLSEVVQDIDLPVYAQQAYIKSSNAEAADFALDIDLSGDGNTMVVGARQEDSNALGVNGNQANNSATDAGAAFIYGRSGGTWTQQAYLKASNTETGDCFGGAVAISADGNTVAIGAHLEDSSATGVNGSQTNNGTVDSGAVYIFTRSGTTWTQQAYLKPTNTGSRDYFGIYVDLSGDGNTLLVSASYEDGAATGVNGNQSSNASFDSGAAYVFTRSGGTWSQRAYLKASNTEADDRFGSAIAISRDGSTVAVGATGEASASTGVNGNQADNSAHSSGATYVFTQSGGNWSQQAYLKASNTEAVDGFGKALSLNTDGSLLAVGAPSEDGSATGVNGPNDNAAANAGAVYLFSRSAGTWSPNAYVKASNTGADDAFGDAVELSADGTTLAVGADGESSSATGVGGNQYDDSARRTGAVYTFSKVGGVFVQRNYVKASNTETMDGFGAYLSLSSDGSTLAVLAPWEASSATGINANQQDNGAPNSSAAYVFTSSLVPTFAHDTYIKASNTGAGDRFGATTVLSADGNTLVVGAHYEDSSATGVNGANNDASTESGAAYVFVRSASNVWTQQAYLKPSNTGAGDHFGRVIALSGDGNTLAVGAVLEDSSATGVNGAQTNEAAADSGAVYVFTRSGTVWTQQAYVKASNTGAGDLFGCALALSSNGNTLAVGASEEDSSAKGINGAQNNNSAADSGAVYVLTRSGTTWTQQAYLKGAQTGAGDGFGSAISLAANGNTLLVGAGREDGGSTLVGGSQTDESAPDAGAAYVFTRSGSTWTQQAYLKASNTEAGDDFGERVILSSDGTTAVIGALLEDGAAVGANGDASSNAALDSGAAYVFTQTGGIWTFQAYLKASNTDAGDSFGAALAISSTGDTLAISAHGEDSGDVGLDGNQTSNGSGAAGAAYLFKRSSGSWTQQSYIKASNTNAGDRFGIDLALSMSANGNRLACGAYLEDSNATGINGNQSNNSSSASGAVYVLSR
jgi:FG-GAP repeat